MNKKAKNTSTHPNFWGMVQNIMIASMRNGYAMLASIFILFLVIFVKLDSHQIMKYIDDLGSTFKSIYYIGWFLFVGLLIYSERRMKRLRQTHSDEMDRISDEKKYLQEKITNIQLSKTKKNKP